MLLLLAFAFTTHFPHTHAYGKVSVSRGNANVVYALSNHLVYRSDDGGATFAQRSELTADVTLTIDPTNDDVVYALSRQPSLQRSIDGGATWWSCLLPSRYIQPTALVVDPKSPSHLIVAGDCPNRGGLHVEEGVWASYDGGESWTKQSPGCTNGIVLDGDGRLYVDGPGGVSATQPIGEVVVDPHAPLLRYAISRSGVGASYDGGATWTAFGLTGMGIYPTSLAIDPISGRLFAGTPSGVFMSENGIPFWRPMPGARSTASNVVVAGTTLFIDTPSGTVRAPLPAMAPLTTLAPLPGMPAAVRALAVDPRRRLLYASAILFDAQSGYGFGGLWRSSDRGASWITVASWDPEKITVDADGDVYAPGFRFVAATGTVESWSIDLPAPSRFLADPTRHGWLYAVSGTGLYASSDGGRTWHRLLKDEQVHGIAVDGNRLYAATAHGVFMSVDTGAAWTRLSDWWALGVAVAPSRPSTLYIEYSQSSMERSDDGGATWHYLHKPTEYIFDSVVVDPLDDRSVWVVAKDGTFHSADSGATWERVDFLKSIVFDADGVAMHVIGESYSQLPGEWDAVVRAERHRAARP